MPRPTSSRDSGHNRTVTSVSDHRATSPSSVRCVVLTISDTRTLDTDTSGAFIVEALGAAGHTIAERTIVRDEPERIREVIVAAERSGNVDAVLTTGGTGITARDGTYETLASLITRPLDGFGEIFRMLSYREIGAAAMLSRACAGLMGRMVVIAMPGSQAAVRLAMTELVIPELNHIVREARR
jgi:molybdopterin adenylyltransferase